MKGGLKPGDSGLVIGYQVDNVTQTWSVECFVALLQHQEIRASMFPFLNRIKETVPPIEGHLYGYIN